jgi:hypothetical protein
MLTCARPGHGIAYSTLIGVSGKDEQFDVELCLLGFSTVVDLHWSPPDSTFSAATVPHLSLACESGLVPC